MLGRAKPIITLCIQQGLLSHFSVYYLQVARWFWETLHYAIRLFFLEGSSTTTDCLLDLTEETTTTLDKGDTDKKLIAFVTSVMLVALLKQIKSGVHAGLLSSLSGPKRVEELKKQLAFIYGSVWMYETFNCTALLSSGKAKTCFHKCLGFCQPGSPWYQWQP